MTRRNRVTPFGTIEAAVVRGRLMGNRGDLGGRDGTLARTARPDVVRWISCSLVEGPRGRVAFDTPGRYTPLFFADEAVALAAGHRPCAACRRPAFLRFVAALRKAFAVAPETPIRAGDVDRVLAAARGERAEPRAARVGDLPDGVFVTRPAMPHRALLLRGGTVRAWDHHGRGPAVPIDPDEIVRVSTPAPIVAVLRAGYLPDVDPADEPTGAAKPRGRAGALQGGPNAAHRRRRAATSST